MYTIRELVKELSKCENQDAIVHIVCGSASPAADEDDIFDVIKFEVFSDHSDDGYQDIFILDKDARL